MPDCKVHASMPCEIIDIGMATPQPLGLPKCSSLVQVGDAQVGTHESNLVHEIHPCCILCHHPDCNPHHNPAAIVDLSARCPSKGTAVQHRSMTSAA